MQYDRPICEYNPEEQTIDDVDFCYESKPFNNWCIACVHDQRMWYVQEMDGGMFSGREGLKDVPNWIYKRRPKWGRVKWKMWGGSQKDRLHFHSITFDWRGHLRWD